MTSRDSANMIVWLIPNKISGKANGSWTFHRVCDGVQPEVVAASIKAWLAVTPQTICPTSEFASTCSPFGQ